MKLLLLLLLLGSSVHWHMDWVRFGTCVCVYEERQVEWEQPWCVVVVSQISEGDGVSMGGGCGREK